ncbi:NRPS protein [Pestalotiopsis sp. IQ-011]
MYGCPTDLLEDIPLLIKRFKKSAFHPLMMPMIFAEHERTRFKEAMELDSPKLKQRIMDLKNMLQADKLRKAEKNRAGRREDNRVTTEQDCEDTELWDEVSQLKIGMESFREMLFAFEQQFTTFGDLKLRSGIGGTTEKIVDSLNSDYIKCRLKEMVAELDTNIRQCEGLLTGMTLALQVTLFSMSFFRWIPDDSPEMISPYVAIYFGLTLIITAVTVRFWVWRSKGKDGNDEKIKRLDARIATILQDMLDSDGMLDSDDVEKGLAGSSSSRNSRFSSSPRDSGAFEMQTGTGI